MQHWYLGGDVTTAQQASFPSSFQTRLFGDVVGGLTLFECCAGTTCGRECLRRSLLAFSMDRCRFSFQVWISASLRCGSRRCRAPRADWSFMLMRLHSSFWSI